MWSYLMDKYDLHCFSEFQHLSNLDIEQIQEDWKAIRRVALAKLNQELNNSGHPGQLLNMDVSDEEIYPYVDKRYKGTFFRCSRILDFHTGYIPKNLIIIKK